MTTIEIEGQTVPLAEIAAVWRLLQDDIFVDWIGDKSSPAYEAQHGLQSGYGPTPWAALVALAEKVK